MDLSQTLAYYVEIFNKNDEACHPVKIPNERAFDFLRGEIPLIDIPDKVIERAYYFRWWTYRKHLKQTPFGYIVTEFLPEVRWAGPYNSINCATPFHIREGRWLKHSKTYMRDYALFFLQGRGDAFSYSMGFISALCDYAYLTGDYGFLTERYALLKAWFDRRAALSETEWGLYYSDDDRDGMEYSISGPGLRPTINSYLCGDAKALARVAKRIGKDADAEAYSNFAGRLAFLINAHLYDGEFYKTIPLRDAENAIMHNKKISPEHDCKELIGYIPWMYGIAGTERDGAWQWLLDARCFLAEFGLTTADMQNPRFMEARDHECLWNGPVWPFATSQTLLALAEAKKRNPRLCVRDEDYCMLLRAYAACHKRVRADGSAVDWIDENVDPFTGEWLARRILAANGFPEEMGGYERGKDYNHSLFCDLVLSGLLGIGEGDGELPKVSPMIPRGWDGFCVQNLTYRNKTYDIYYDANGEKYGKGRGISIFPAEHAPRA